MNVYAIRKKKNIITVSIILLILLFTSFIPATAGANINQDKLDQEQPLEYPKNTFESFYKNKCLAQGFSPTLENLTRIQLNLSKDGDITSDIIIILKKINLSTPEIINVTIPGSFITGKKWYQVNFTNMILDINQKYFIICKTEGGDENNSYRWHASNFDNYYNPKGWKYNSSDNGQTWEENSTWDFCFKTFGKEFVRETKLEIQYLKSGTATQIEFGVKNIGETTINKFYYTSKIVGGLVIIGREYINQSFLIPAGLEPGETYSNYFPAFGFGRVSINFSAWTDKSDPAYIEKGGFFFFIYNYIRP